MMASENDREIGDMNARITALERAVAQLLTDRDRMFSILDEIQRSLAVAAHRLDELTGGMKEYLRKCETCREDISDLKHAAKGGTSGFAHRVLNPWSKPIGVLFGEVAVQAFKVVAIGATVAAIIYFVGGLA